MITPLAPSIRNARPLLLSVCLWMAAQVDAADSARDFILADGSGAATFLVADDLDPAVARAANDVCRDIERVSGHLPPKSSALDAKLSSAVLVGVVGKTGWLETLAAAGKIDLRPLAGAWETFVVAVVEQPWPGLERALVVAGSDRRGAIYGLYEISNLIGVSPWHWWADVPVPKQSRLTIPVGRNVVGPPSVKYRGIFINDEDWAMLPWAAETFEPESGNLGPKTYAKVFGLVLRLRANLVWPGMHPTTRAFNDFPENKQVADAYGVVMGSSHAEPMLRNNVGEWKLPAHDYNYIANRAGVLDYWERRVAENGRYENVYTLGMRGIHDSLMVGPRDDPERVRTLERIFADQRALLARYVSPDVRKIPQMFCAYKEVLSLYRLGLKVPDDAIFVWPDDNFGYIRGFDTDAERRRSGGSGVYYHLSYLGRPLAYLWLSSIPPSLIWQQLHQAYEHGADQLWIANVGDIKPAEISMEFFLQMAWDVERWTPQNLPRFLEQWARRDFGAEHAGEIAAIMAEYYALNFERKPEHLQWWRPGQERRPSALTDAEVAARLAAFASLRARSERVKAAVPREKHDAYFQLVHYPVIGSALANERYFFGEQGKLAEARAADEALQAETKRYNEKISGGKWRRYMALEPADGQWSTMRIAPWAPFPEPRRPRPSPSPGSFLVLKGSDFHASQSRGASAWTVIPGLGRSGGAITVLPSTAPHRDLAEVTQ
ncbi:MAG TPA: glycosyl hydrolase 115 family protein, partial [Opitutaceae bacterium]